MITGFVDKNQKCKNYKKIFKISGPEIFKIDQVAKYKIE
jgi:hypothetical protein